MKKNIGICYSEHAIKVSDSYCSGPANRAYASSHSIQNAVTCIYKVKPSSHGQFLIGLTWRNRSNQGFSIAISDCNYQFSVAKFSNVKSRVLNGSENFESGGLKADVFWDFRRAKYESGPEPITGFYVVVVINSEVSLILGDMEKELDVKKRGNGENVCEFSLISRSEQFSGSGVYSSRAKFSETGICHDIMIKWCGEDPKNPMVSVYVDKKNVVQVKRLQWNFRGNHSIFLDGLMVDLMWDVHDWLFNSSSSGDAVFLFRTRKGFDSRLWLEDDRQEKVGFCFLISACKNPD